MAKRTSGRDKQKKRERSSNRRYIQIVWIPLFLLFVTAGFILLSQKQTKISSAASQVDTPQAISKWDQMVKGAEKQVRYYRGAPDAPVTLLEFGDFQ